MKSVCVAVLLEAANATDGCQALAGADRATHCNANKVCENLIWMNEAKTQWEWWSTAADGRNFRCAEAEALAAQRFEPVAPDVSRR